MPARIASANRLPIAASRVRTVAVEESSATAVVQIASVILSSSAASKRATAAATSGSGVTRRGIDHAELRPPRRDALAAVLAHRDRDVDAGDVMRVVAGLDQRALAVVIDEQVVRVAGEQQVGRALVLQLDRVAAIAMQDRADEVRAFAPQRRGLRLRGVDGRAEAQILRRGHARRLLVGKPGQPDAHAVDRDASSGP